MKKSIRAELLRKRDAIPPALKAQKDAAIWQRLSALEEFRRAENVMMYVSFRSEADTKRFLQNVIAFGKKLILPFVDSKNRVLELYEVRDASELVRGYMGIPEPGIKENRRVDFNAVDLIIIPGVGFDIKGNRLGYGGGYYDRLLSGIGDRGSETSKKEPARTPQPPSPCLIALAFEEQIVEEIPSESHDIKMDMIVTEKRLIRCASH